MWFRSKYRALFESVNAELENAQNLFHVEHAKRIAAETIAEERRMELERTWQQVAAANDARNEAVAERMKSLDLVNTHLLGAMAPEQKPPDIKNFKQQPKHRQQAVTMSRHADRMFMQAALSGKLFQKKQEKPEEPIQ